MALGTTWAGPDRCAEGEVPAEAEAEGADSSANDGLSWGAGEGTMAIAALMVE